MHVDHAAGKIDSEKFDRNFIKLFTLSLIKTTEKNSYDFSLI